MFLNVDEIIDSTGTPLLRRYLLGRISDLFFEVEKQSYFLIRTVFTEKFDFDHQKVTNFQKKKLDFFLKFFFFETFNPILNLKIDLPNFEP